MTRQRSSRTRISVNVSLFLAALTFLVPVAALAQELDSSAVITSDGLLPVVAYPSGGPRAWMLVVTDVNGDHKPDLVIVNHGNGGIGSIGVRLGKGDGTFRPSIVHDSGGVGPTGITVGDVNGDGKPDVVVAELCAGGANNCVGVLLGNGDGTFKPAATYPIGGRNWWAFVRMPIFLTDLNSDGKLDLVALNRGQTSDASGDGSVSVLLGNGDGTFQPAATYDSGGFSLFSGVVADLNGDGKFDIVLLNCGPSGSTLCGSSNETMNETIGVLPGNGDGTFQPVRTYTSGGPGGFFASPLMVADVNGDGKPDILVGNRGSFSVLLANGDGTFRHAVTYDSGWGDVQSLAVADLTGDGIPDLLVGGGAVGVWRGNGDGTFQLSSVYPTATSQLFLADVDGDGKVDLIGIDGDGGSADVRLGNGDGTFQARQTLPLGGVSSWATVADVNGDGKPDLLSANQCPRLCVGQPGMVGVLLDGTRTQASTVTTVLSSLNPSTYGQPVTLTATVASNLGIPTGTVTFWAGSVQFGSASLANGTASISIPYWWLGAGSYSIAAEYRASSGFVPSMSSPITQVVNPAWTSTQLHIPSMHSGVGYVGLWACVYSGFGTRKSGPFPTGSVTFYAGSEALGSAPLNSRACTSLNALFTARGNYTLSAKYSGDPNNLPSTSDTFADDISDITHIQLSTSQSPSWVGQSVTLTAVFSPNNWGGGIPPAGETVTFGSATQLIGTATITTSPYGERVATLTTSSLKAGTYTIRAAYGGDTRIKPAVGTVVQTVNQYSTSTSFTSSLNPSIYGQAVTFTGRVTGTGPFPPTGKVEVTAAGHVIGYTTLNSSGVAILSKSNLSAGTYPLTAIYKGDVYNHGSTSAVASQVVEQATSAATLISAPTPSIIGQAVTFTARITSTTSTPSGPVTFTLGQTTLGTAQLSSGKATFTTSSLPAGSNVVKVIYNGNSNIKGSSASVTQVVQP